MSNSAAPVRAPGSRRDVMVARGGATRRETVRRLLARWRAAERDLGRATPGTDAWLLARTEFDAARRAYLDEMERRPD